MDYRSLPKEEALAYIASQESETILAHFDAEDLSMLCRYLMDMADEAKEAITVRIVKGKQMLFQYTARDNAMDREQWLTRKINTCQLFGHASLTVRYKTDASMECLEHKYGLTHMEYTYYGGAVCIAVKGVGVIGALAISGFSNDWIDHNQAVAALQWLKEKQQ